MAIRRFAHLITLLAANVVTHAWLLIYAGSFSRIAPMNDVQLYGYWLQQMRTDHFIFGVNQPWVYPAGALLPMLLAELLSFGHGVLFGWVLMMALLSSIVIGALVDWGRAGSTPYLAAWFWVSAVAILGPVSISRIDSVSVLIAIAGLLAFANSRIRLALVFFSFGAWIKIWPVAHILGTFIADRRKKFILVSAGIISAVFILLALLVGGDSSVLSFVFTQSDRGIQIESTLAMFWLWAAKLHMPNVGIYFDEQMLTNQVSGVYADLASALITPIMFGALVITGLLGWRAFLAGAAGKRIFTLVSLTAVLDLIVFNKVGSPQFMTWLFVPVIAWIYFELEKRWMPIALTFVIALLTHAVYPVFYEDLMGLGDVSMALLTGRNALLVVFLIWANLQLSNEIKNPKAA